MTLPPNSDPPLSLAYVRKHNDLTRWMPLWVTASVLVHELLFLGWIQYQTRMPREDAPLAIEFIDLDTVTATPTEP